MNDLNDQIDDDADRHRRTVASLLTAAIFVGAYCWITPIGELAAFAFRNIAEHPTNAILWAGVPLILIMIWYTLFQLIILALLMWQTTLCYSTVMFALTYWAADYNWSNLSGFSGVMAAIMYIVGLFSALIGWQAGTVLGTAASILTGGKAPAPRKSWYRRMREFLDPRDPMEIDPYFQPSPEVKSWRLARHKNGWPVIW